MEYLLLPPDTRNTGFLCVRYLNKPLVWGSVLHLCPVIMCKSIKNTSMCIKIRPESYTWCLPEPRGMLWRISGRIFNKERARRCISDCGSILFKTTTSQSGLFTGSLPPLSALCPGCSVYGKMKEQNKNLKTETQRIPEPPVSTLFRNISVLMKSEKLYFLESNLQSWILCSV